ncbi:MAG TPA: prepilin peptidase [Mollicutes bacterium]|nr:prepilin peptidase [Mollicutes bacterium]
MSIFIFVFGLLMGSFYNVVGLRLLKNESIVKPRSHCPKCKYQLKWYENIPVFSFLFLKGKCKNCNINISFMYISIEILTGVLFLISFHLFGITEQFFISLVISSLVVLIFITDSKEMIILDEVLITGGILIFIIKLIYGGIISALSSIFYGFVVFLFVYGIMLFGNFIFKKESMGGGDIKLSFISGMILGIPLGIFYLVLASFLAFPYAVYISFKNKEGILPFGPFLAISLFLTYANYDFILNILKNLFLMN